VQRLTQLEHHVVGDVDDGRDGTNTAALEALLHPGWRGGRGIDRFDDARNETGARVGVLDADFALRATRHRRRRIGEGHQRALVIAATSRAIPRIDRQSARLGVILSVISESSRPSAARRSCPKRHLRGAQAVRRVGVDAEFARRAEHTCDSTPRIVARSMRCPPGSCAPTTAQGTFIPAQRGGRRKRYAGVRPRQRPRRICAGDRRLDGIDLVDPCHDDAEKGGRPDRRTLLRARPWSAGRTGPRCRAGDRPSCAASVRKFHRWLTLGELAQKAQVVLEKTGADR